MTKPVIGIVAALKVDPEAVEHRTLHSVGTQYVDALRKAGASVVIIPQGTDPADVLPMLDGWLIMGGPDISPHRYGESRHPETSDEDTGRFDTEVALYEAVPTELPVFGICYGCQFLNVQRGGTLVQHIMDDPAKGEHRADYVHSHRVVPGTRLAAVTEGAEFDAVSSHHQAIGKVGDGLQVDAWASDGTIEGLEDTSGRWMVAVQWHPERTPDSPETIRMLRAFVEAAIGYKESKEACGTW